MAASSGTRTRPARRPRVGEDRAATYRLYPTANQARGLDELVMWQRRLYNAALEERRGAWKLERRSVTKFDQYRQLSGERTEGWEWLERFGVGVCRGTLTRLDEAFSHFFRRVKAGATPGFPRFQGVGRFDSLQWEGATGWKLTRTGSGSYGSGPHHHARHLHEAMNLVSTPGTKNVVIAFMDYDPPDAGDFVNAARSESAIDGGRNLDSLVGSLRADGYRPDQIVPIGYSYGSTVIGHSISDFGLGVDRVGVVGSPGLGAGIHDAGMLGDVDIYAGRAQGVEVFGAGDAVAVALAPFHGEDPTDEGFGASVFSTGSAYGHNEYFVQRSESILNLARIATGQEPQ